MSYLKFSIFLFFVFSAILPLPASAHENYVLPQADIDRGMLDWSVNVFSALKDPHNVEIAFFVGLGILILFALYYFLLSSHIGLSFKKKTNLVERVGHVVLRIALAASFLASAYFNAFLGPEIPLSSLPGGELLAPLLFILGIFLLLGFLTEIVSVLGILLLGIATYANGTYMLTYFNYFGQFAALIFFGSRIFSLDTFITKATAFVKKYRSWELPIIRITYGISVLYPAIMIKILHHSIIVEIAEKYHLSDIYWLFPADPLLISLGTGLAQIVLGLCIIFGFETRLNSFLTFILYIFSILFFKEAVWPHYILLALAFYLVINDGGKWSVDSWIERKKLKAYRKKRANTNRRKHTNTTNRRRRLQIAIR